MEEGGIRPREVLSYSFTRVGVEDGGSFMVGEGEGREGYTMIWSEQLFIEGWLGQGSLG